MIASLNPRSLWILAIGIVLTIFLFFRINHTSSSSTWRIPTSFSKSSDGTLVHDIFNNTLGFQKIFVINMKSRPDHRDAMALAGHLTGLDFEFVDGVSEDLPEKAWPPHAADYKPSAQSVKSWRAHQNVARRIVEQNLTSAMIMEDDCDWDIRIKEISYQVSGAVRQIVQPIQGTKDQYQDPTIPRTSDAQQQIDLQLGAGPATKTPTSSPWGDVDQWDLIWLGHCGTRWPEPSDHPLPLGRVLWEDMTVPEPQYISKDFGSYELQERYPPHTRAVHRLADNVCTLAYGLSQTGAQRMLHDLGVDHIDGPADIMMRDMCMGINGRKARTCISVQPTLFQHHWPRGLLSSQSELSDHGEGFNEVASTTNIRLSTKLNFEKLMNGDTDYRDSYPDTKEVTGAMLNG